MELKKYNPEAVCPKCGSDNINTHYCMGEYFICKADITYGHPALHNHIDRYCCNCGYAWAELCLDDKTLGMVQETPTQIDILAGYIMANIPGEPSESEGAGETAVRLLKRYRHALMDIRNATGPIYQIGHDCDRAYRIAREAL